MFFKKICWKGYLKILRLCLYVNKVYYHVAISVGLRGLKQVTKNVPDGKGWWGVVKGGKAGSKTEDLLKD